MSCPSASRPRRRPSPRTISTIFWTALRRFARPAWKVSMSPWRTASANRCRWSRPWLNLMFRTAQGRETTARTLMPRRPVISQWSGGALRSACSCLNLILAFIVYWEAPEISRVLSQCDPVANGIDFNTVFPKSPRLRAIPPISLTMVICCNNSLNFVRSLAPSPFSASM